MTYKLLPLEKHQATKDNLLFWVKHFFIYKLNTLDMNVSKDLNFDLAKVCSDILIETDADRLLKIANRASKVVKGLKPFVKPSIEFYKYIESLQLESIREIDQHLVKQYIITENSSWENTKKNNYYGKLKTLFRFIQDHNTLPNTKEPFMFNIGLDVHGNSEKIIHARQKQDIPKFLELEDMQKLDKSVLQYKKYSSDIERARHILIIRLLMIGMITLSELKKIKASDFLNTDDMEVLELNVGSRTVPIPRGKFIQYLNLYKKSKECEKSEYLFCGTYKCNEISTNTVLSIIQTHFEDANIRAKATAETLRNSGAIYLHRYRGVGDIKIQELLGHKNKQTTKNLLKAGNITHLQVARIWDNFKD